MTDFPWIKSYPPGMHWDAALPIVSAQQILDDAADQWPQHAALSFMGRTITYRQLQESANHAAKGFQALGVKPGVHVGLYLPNTQHYLISFFGILKAGGTVVNYSPLDAEKVLGHKIEDSQTDFIVTLDLALLYPQMDHMLGQTRLQKIIVGSLAEMSAQPDAVDAHLQQAGLLASVAWDAQHITFDQLLANDGVFQAYPISDPATALAVLQYTGGTTGLPKGAMLTHGNLSAATAQIMSTIHGDSRVLEEGKERLLAVLPLFHIYVKGPNVMQGYWNNPDATKQSTTHDGYFRTGDVATMDDDGFVYLVDRTKDMILCGGFNVYPRIIEEAIYEHPAVSEVTVIGIHDAYRGESPKAFITLKTGAPPFTLDEMKLFLKGRLGKYEMLQAMDIRLSLPKTPVGKLSKKELYEEEARKRPAS